MRTFLTVSPSVFTASLSASLKNKKNCITYITKINLSSKSMNGIIKIKMYITDLIKRCISFFFYLLLQRNVPDPVLQLL